MGSLLIEHGLLNEEQLAAALEAQKRSGAPLGKVLIELGFVEPAVVALALATQSGGVLKTEYGFATGFRPRQEGAPVLEPPLSEPEDEKASASELRIAQPPPPVRQLHRSSRLRRLQKRPSRTVPPISPGRSRKRNQTSRRRSSRRA